MLILGGFIAGILIAIGGFLYGIRRSLEELVELKRRGK